MEAFDQDGVAVEAQLHGLLRIRFVAPRRRVDPPGALPSSRHSRDLRHLYFRGRGGRLGARGEGREDGDAQGCGDGFHGLPYICLNRWALARETASSVLPSFSFTKTRPPRSRRVDATSRMLTTVLRWTCRKTSASSCGTSSASGVRINASPSRVMTQVYLSDAWKYSTSSTAICRTVSP